MAAAVVAVAVALVVVTLVEVLLSRGGVRWARVGWAWKCTVHYDVSAQLQA